MKQKPTTDFQSSTQKKSRKKKHNTYQTRGEQNYKIKRGNTNFALRVLFPVVAIAELNDG